MADPSSSARAVEPSVARRIAAQIGERLDGHVASGDAFVVSIYGEWGIGKTRCLHDIEAHFAGELREAIARAAEETPESVVVPVFFDPWQYEHEDHLVVPLLKTIEFALRRVADEVDRQNPPSAPATPLGGRLRQAGQVFGDVAVSLLAGFKFKFAPLKEIIGIETDFSPKDALEAVRKAAEKRAAAKPAAAAWHQRLWGSGAPPAEPAPPERDEAHARLARRESLYFDVRTALAALTSGVRPRLRLVMLIDDLDRCLPEKAIQVLESVKLFLNVRGFSFVLAVDDEVVERGIAHRYKDYQIGALALSTDSAAPISGSEYLEKIVHLPVHLQRWTVDEAAAFLRRGFPTLFGAPAEAGAPPGSEDPRAAALLALVTRSLPLVPRKLIRLAEALEFLRRQFAELEAMSYWSPLHGVRVVTLQQLYPALYRHLRLGPGRYWRLFEIVRNEYGDPSIGRGRDLESLRELFRTRAQVVADDPTTSAQRKVETNELREQFNLLELVQQSGRQRGAPDPLQLFAVAADSPERRPESIAAGLTLEGFARLYVHGVRLPATGPVSPVQTDDRVPIADVQAADELIAALTRGDHLSRRERLDRDSLYGKRLPDPVFEELLRHMKDPASASHIVESEWLRDIQAITGPEQLLRLYTEFDVLGRVQAAEQAGATP